MYAYDQSHVKDAALIIMTHHHWAEISPITRPTVVSCLCCRRPAVPCLSVRLTLLSLLFLHLSAHSLHIPPISGYSLAHVHSRMHVCEQSSNRRGLWPWSPENIWNLIRDLVHSGTFAWATNLRDAAPHFREQIFCHPWQGRGVARNLLWGGIKFWGRYKTLILIVE